MSSFTAFGIVARRRAEEKLDLFEFVAGLMVETGTANLVKRAQSGRCWR
jgi:hypothetical protein